MTTPNPSSVTTKVARFLVTSEVGPRMDLWAVTGTYSNFIEGRANHQGGDVETWIVTVAPGYAALFLEAAGIVDGDVTVEEIELNGDVETYVLHLGEPGTGWVKP